LTACREESRPVPTPDPGGDVIDYLALGDSYTIGESVPESQRWPVQLAEKLRFDGYDVAPPEIIAQTGWRTDQLRAAIAAANLRESYGLISLLIGVNNEFQGRDTTAYRSEFTQLLETAIALADGRPERVFVLSIPDYAYTPFGQTRPNPARISERLDAYNAINEEISAAYGVAWFNITPISRRGLAEPAFVAGDGLHPSGQQYTEWVELIRSGVGELLR
jgi:lysophospholipase L1-like esterase